MNDTRSHGGSSIAFKRTKSTFMVAKPRVALRSRASTRRSLNRCGRAGAAGDGGDAAADVVDDSTARRVAE
eukprot:5085035-Heterocapsa_arctica.AAC.1